MDPVYHRGPCKMLESKKTWRQKQSQKEVKDATDFEETEGGH